MEAAGYEWNRGCQGDSGGLNAFSGTSAGEAVSMERAVDPCFQGKRILLAEDNELNCEAAREMLSVLE